MTGSSADRTWSTSIPYLETRFPYIEHEDATQALDNVAQYLCDNWPSNESDKPGSSFTLHRDGAAWATYVFPGALKGRIESAALVTQVIFLLDDATEEWTLAEKKQLFGRFPELVLGTTTPIPGNQYEVVIADLFSRFRATDKPGRLALGLKFCEENIHWLKTSTKQENRVHMWAYSLLYWVHDLSLPQYIQDDLDLRAVEDIGGRHGMLVNDLFSYDVEVNTAKRNSECRTITTIVNAIPVVMKEKSVKEEDAINFISNYIHQFEDEFLEIEAKLNAKYSGDDQRICERYEVWSGRDGAYDTIRFVSDLK
ncbi:isoprenoid synthase domain-containing protein [Crucibulum laeve]|uniref:Isoprenoid synthase domain-containing protein n=1 Tax=Crucibulum laeve TaxID=68775 RepID=A0A5C3LY60_9AGAR|nr:isoprenoid synthase domain-containing protein [Crucibulum laeve]